MTTTLLTTAPLSAQENMETIKRTQRSTSENFIDASVAMFWIRELKQYKELGFDRLEAFLDSQGIEVSKAQFHAMANLGSALRWINTTREELAEVGYSAMIEIVRLARTKDGAKKHKNDIARLITRKAKGLTDVAGVRSEVKTLLGESTKQADAAPAPAPAPAPVEVEDNSGDTTSAPDWRAPFLKMLHSAKDPADYLAMLDDMRGE